MFCMCTVCGGYVAFSTHNRTMSAKIGLFATSTLKMANLTQLVTRQRVTAIFREALRSEKHFFFAWAQGMTIFSHSWLKSLVISQPSLCMKWLGAIIFLGFCNCSLIRHSSARAMWFTSVFSGFLTIEYRKTDTRKLRVTIKGAWNESAKMAATLALDISIPQSRANYAEILGK